MERAADPLVRMPESSMTGSESASASPPRNALRTPQIAASTDKESDEIH